MKFHKIEYKLKDALKPRQAEVLLDGKPLVGVVGIEINHNWNEGFCFVNLTMLADVDVEAVISDDGVRMGVSTDISDS